MELFDSSEPKNISFCLTTAKVGLGSNTYKQEIKKKFYYRSNDGKTFGRLEVEVRPFFNKQAKIYIYYWLNPQGSTNLEDDEVQHINLQTLREEGLEKAIKEAKEHAARSKQ